jgi:AcrR family transcriptional regulator
MSKKRARSEEAKAEQVKKIIEISREIFLTDGFKGFSMRTVANRLGMSQSNLYNYWSSKRELWYAIIRHDFQVFEDELMKLVSSHKGSLIELLEKFGYFYFKFAEDNFRRYQMMFVLPPPPSGTVGPTELEFEPTTIQTLVTMLRKADESGILKGVDVEKLSLYLWSVVHGVTYVSHSVVFHPDSKMKNFGAAEDFQKFVIELLKAQLNTFIQS